jgi:hypothetical protein
MDNNKPIDDNKVFNADEIFKDVDTPKEEKTVIPEEKKEETPVMEEVKTEEKVPEKSETKVPVKGAEESDESYQIRLQIKEAKEARDMASSDEEKSLYQERMNSLKKSFPEKKDSPSEEKKEEIDFEKFEQSVIEKTQAEFDRRFAELKKGEVERSHTEVLKNFYKSRPDIASNAEAVKMLEEEVFSLVKLSYSTTPSELDKAFKLVSNYRFPKVNRVQEARNAQEKREILNANSSSKAQTSKKGMSEQEEAVFRGMGWTDKDLATFG